MFEPILRPRTGILLNSLGVIVAVGGVLVSETVTTSGGVVPFSILMPIVAGGFILRLVGLSVAVARHATAMPWTVRVLSWVAFGFAAALLGLAGSASAVAAFGAFIVLDAVGGFLKRRPEIPETQTRRVRDWAAARRWLIIFLYLALVAVIHVFVSAHLPFGTLLTWSLLAFGFALLARASLVGFKAREEALRPPADHRLHERVISEVRDPHRERAEAVLLRFRAQGDAGPFLDLVADAMRAADFPEREIEAMKNRITDSFARAGTRRDEDVRAALDEVEKALSPRRLEVAH